MIRRRLQVGTVLAACALFAPACGTLKESIAMSNDRASASRLPPPDVAPVTIAGVRYAQRPGKEAVDGQVGGILGAYDAGGTLLWTLKVYDNRRRPDLEGDVQDVYFSSMTADPDGRLRIVNEEGDAFLVDVKARSVTALPKAKRPGGGGLQLP